MKKILLIALGVVLAGALILGGCPGEKTTTPTTTAPPQVLKLGCSLPLEMIQGITIQRWLELIAKDINESGGWEIGGQKYQIQWFFYNDAYSAEGGATAAQKLVYDDGVKFILNQFGDPPVIATLKVTEPNKVLVVSCTLTDEPKKTTYNYSFTATGCLGVSAGYSISVAEDFVARGAKTAITLNMDNDIGHSRDAMDLLMYPKVGLKIIDSLYFPTGTTDFSPIITKLVSEKPDVALLQTLLGDEINKCIQELHDVGYDGYVDCINMDNHNVDALIGKIGPEYLEGMHGLFYDNRQYTQLLTPEVVRLINLYEQEYGSYDIEGTFWTANWFAFKAAVDATQSLDVDVLSDYLANRPSPSANLTGWVVQVARPDIGQFRTVDAASSLMQGIVHNGKMVPYRMLSAEWNYRSFIRAVGLEDIYQKYWDQYGYPEFPEQNTEVIFTP